ncbi:hypothetical protein [Mesorhizobium sp.]|uniref:hypothetical protein n=1 Tax=Mesorhizobium sp. TaxID=1871066 RepID=UPI0025B8ACB0|nr:hypothetical protein [Mesorhizobium sp.]
MVKQTDLRVFDPIWTATNITADHGAAIYDTLFSFDSKLMPQLAGGASPTTRRPIRSSCVTGWVSTTATP